MHRRRSAVIDAASGRLNRDKPCGHICVETLIRGPALCCNMTVTDEAVEEAVSYTCVEEKLSDNKLKVRAYGNCLLFGFIAKSDLRFGNISTIEDGEYITVVLK